MAQQTKSKISKAQSVTPQPTKNGAKKAQQSTFGDSIRSLCCPKCKQLLAGVDAVRLRSCPKLTRNMQKLLRKRQEGEKNLTARQHQLLQRAMQRCNVLVLKCSPCQWRSEIKLQCREAIHRHKARLRHKAERERQSELAGCEEGDSLMPDKKAQKKLKKKERRKKAAEAKAEELQRFKRFSNSPVMGGSDRPGRAPLASTPLPVLSAPPLPVLSAPPSPSPCSPAASRKAVSKAGGSSMFTTPVPSPARTGNQSDRLTPRSGSHRSGGPTPGKQKLRKVLNEKKANRSANESLLQFLNSLK